MILPQLCGNSVNSSKPVTVKPASDLAVVSWGWAPPRLRVYLPGRMERIPLPLTLDSERGSMERLTSRLGLVFREKDRGQGRRGVYLSVA
jgi:hypothetical protein